MSGAFFARYVPPLSIKQEQKQSSPAATVPSQSKKRKRSAPRDADAVPAEAQSHGSPNAELNLPNGQGKVKKKKEKKKKAEKSQTKVQDDASSAIVQIEANKHKKIKARFQKSSERASDPRGDSDVEQEDGPKLGASEVHGLEAFPQPMNNLVQAKPTYSTLPPWLAKPIRVSADSQISFQKLSLHHSTLENLEKRKYHNAFAIQAAVLPLLLPGPDQHRGDVCVSAATGSGKTLAYTLPMVEALRNKPVRRLRGLIVVPTRELVAQVRENLEMCAAGAGLRIGAAVGSKAMSEEKGALMEKDIEYDPDAYEKKQTRDPLDWKRLLDWDRDDEEDEKDVPPYFLRKWSSAVDILICTPGRLVDHMRSTKGFTLEHVQWLVIDEADRLLDQSFQQWVEIVIPALKWMPTPDATGQMLINLFHMKRTRRVKKVILSATMTKDVSKLLELELDDPVFIALENEKDPAVLETLSTEGNLVHTLPATLREFAVPLRREDDKPLVLLQLMKDVITAQKAKSPDATGINDEDEALSAERSISDQSDSGSSADSSTSSGGTSSNEDQAASESCCRPPKQASPTIQTRGVLIFTNTNEAAMRLSRLLIILRPSWSSDLATLTKSTASSAGRRILSAFKSHKLSVLIASDRASRGLDIQNLAQVINYDIPTSVTNYVHRVGRTARAGRSGTATTIVAHHEGRWFWNEIGKEGRIRRAEKVRRLEEVGKGVTKQDRHAYGEALKQLGEEATGRK